MLKIYTFKIIFKQKNKSTACQCKVYSLDSKFDRARLQSETLINVHCNQVSIGYSMAGSGIMRIYL